MKSPTDNDELSKMIYEGPILEEEYIHERKNRRSTFRKIVDRISVCFQQKPDVTLDQKRDSRNEPKKMYSFTELELNKFAFEKITTNSTVQTGESLEMQTYSNQSQETAAILNEKLIEVSSNSPEDVEEQEYYVNELTEVTSMMEPKRDLHAIKLLKLLREARGSLDHAKAGRSAVAAPRDEFSELSTSDEREVRNLLYDFPGNKKESCSSLIVSYDPSDIVVQTQPFSKQPTPEACNTKKYLRFEEAATVIPSVTPIESVQNLPSQAGSLPSGEVSGMDFMRFWNIKPKKPKNKGTVSLREK